jgi:hypothetical protein
VFVMFTLNMEIGDHSMRWWMLYGKNVFILLAACVSFKLFSYIDRELGMFP